MKSATPPFLTRMTQVDYDTDMVMVAFQKLNGSEKFLGIARYMGDADEAKAELSVVVGEDVRNKGIGRNLIASCLTAAEDHEIGLVWVVVSSDNTAMLHLGEKMGFTVVETQGSHEFELRIKPDERQTVIKTLPETVPLFPGLQGLEKGSAGGART
jgi:ribosomal protein S18 acetylase RimI-like enzyme